MAQKGGGNWNNLVREFKLEVRSWGALNRSPDSLLADVEEKMETLLLQNTTHESLLEEKELQKEHD